MPSFQPIITTPMGVLSSIGGLVEDVRGGVRTIVKYGEGTLDQRIASANQEMKVETRSVTEQALNDSVNRLMAWGDKFPSIKDACVNKAVEMIQTEMSLPEAQQKSQTQPDNANNKG